VCLDITLSVDIKQIQKKKNLIYETLKRTASKNNIYTVEVPISFDFIQTLLSFI